MSSSGCDTLALSPDLFSTEPFPEEETVALPETEQKVTVTPSEKQTKLSIASIEPAMAAAPDATLEERHEAGDIWEVVRNTQRLRTVSNERVQRQIAWYQNYTKTLERVSANAKPYMHFIMQEVQRRQLPSELALIPVIESGFRPLARSSSGATGLWQFIGSTGRRFGLAQNRWYDGRRDVVASTRAAFDYLEYLERRFDGDWLLAIASYNAGEGSVHRAVKRNRAANKPTDYWSLDLPKETQIYVPRLLAVAQIVRQPEIFGLKITSVANARYFQEVELPRQTDLALVARLAAISMAEVRALNPGYKHLSTPPEGPHRILVPSESAEQFITAMASLPVDQFVVSKRHVIAAGDTLGRLANRYHTTVAALQTLNNLKSTRIREGRTLIVPTAVSSADERPGVNITKEDHDPVTTGVDRLRYTVRSGDSLWTIARRHDTTVKKLVDWNDISRDAMLRLGQKLEIWSASATALVPLPEQATQNRNEKVLRYTITHGDSLWEISRRFGVSVVALRKWNDLPRDRLLQPGQKLDVYVGDLDQARL
jgi:membrane-bound lytic murein transglycosylase D